MPPELAVLRDLWRALRAGENGEHPCEGLGRAPADPDGAVASPGVRGFAVGRG